MEEPLTRPDVENIIRDYIRDHLRIWVGLDTETFFNYGVAQQEHRLAIKIMLDDTLIDEHSARF